MMLIQSYPTPFHPIASHPSHSISLHPIHHIPYHCIPSHYILSHPISYHSIPSHRIPPHPIHPIPYHCIPSHPIPSRPIPTHHGAQPTSREEPVGVLDERLDDAHNLQGDGRHHLCDIPATQRAVARWLAIPPRPNPAPCWDLQPPTPWLYHPLLCSTSRSAGAAPTSREQNLLAPHPRTRAVASPPITPLHPRITHAHGHTLPFCLWPQEVGTQHDGHVARRHFVHVLVFGQLGQEFDQVPGGVSAGMVRWDVPSAAPAQPLTALCSPDVVVVGLGQLLAGIPQGLQPLLLLWDAMGGEKLCVPESPKHQPTVLRIRAPIHLPRYCIDELIHLHRGHPCC